MISGSPTGTIVAVTVASPSSTPFASDTGNVAVSTISLAPSVPSTVEVEPLIAGGSSNGTAGSSQISTVAKSPPAVLLPSPVEAKPPSNVPSQKASTA